MQNSPHFEIRPITNHIQKVRWTSFPATSLHLPSKKTNYTCKTRTYTHKAGKHTHTHKQKKQTTFPTLETKPKFTQSTTKQFFLKKKKKKLTTTPPPAGCPTSPKKDCAKKTEQRKTPSSPQQQPQPANPEQNTDHVRRSYANKKKLKNSYSKQLTLPELTQYKNAKISKKKSHRTKATRSFLSGKKKQKQIQNKTDWLQKKFFFKRLKEKKMQNWRGVDRGQREREQGEANLEWEVAFALFAFTFFCVGPPFGNSFGGVRFSLLPLPPFLPCPLFTQTRSLFG